MRLVEREKENHRCNHYRKQRICFVSFCSLFLLFCILNARDSREFIRAAVANHIIAADHNFAIILRREIIWYERNRERKSERERGGDGGI